MRKYDDEFKQLVLSKVFDGQSVASVANELGVNESSIHLWRRERLKNGSVNGATSGEQEREIVELKKKLREAQMENEILKKAALIFGRGS
jgi:transposase-like protein